MTISQTIYIYIYPTTSSCSTNGMPVACLMSSPLGTTRIGAICPWPRMPLNTDQLSHPSWGRSWPFLGWAACITATPAAPPEWRARRSRILVPAKAVVYPRTRFAVPPYRAEIAKGHLDTGYRASPPPPNTTRCTGFAPLTAEIGTVRSNVTIRPALWNASARR